MGVRIAYWCIKCVEASKNKQDGPGPERVFMHKGQTIPRCPTHGVMTRQENNAYLGKEASGEMKAIQLTLDNSVVDIIDEIRGDVPRVRWIRRAISNQIEEESSGSQGRQGQARQGTSKKEAANSA